MLLNFHFDITSNLQKSCKNGTEFPYLSPDSLNVNSARFYSLLFLLTHTRKHTHFFILNNLRVRCRHNMPLLLFCKQTNKMDSGKDVLEDRWWAYNWVLINFFQFLLYAWKFFIIRIREKNQKVNIDIIIYRPYSYRFCQCPNNVL